MLLQEYKFGYADATKELMIEPEIFEKAFYDSHNILDKLMNSWKYMLVGRKGVGKSAYSSKIQYISEHEKNCYAYTIQLDDFEYTTFGKASVDKDLVGTKKFLYAWNFVILLNIYKIIYEQLEITEGMELNEIIELLKKMGFPVSNSFKTTVTGVSRLKLGATVGIFDAEFEKEFGFKPISFADRIGVVVEKMQNTLKKVYLPQKLFVLIDGVDDILRIKKNQLDILSSLIRSIDMLNQNMFKNKVNIKLLLFIREDIINQITDPDLNKIKRDGSIKLSWVDNTEDLKQIAELRFRLTENNEEDSWNKIFPSELQGKKSWDTLLEHTLYKPRDILQFLCVCQELYPNNTKLTYSEMKAAIKKYSSDYFIEEMKNELSGYISDVLINTLPSTFQRLGSNSFTFEKLLQVINEQSSTKEYSEQDVRQLVLVLFESGYVGQLINGNLGKTSVVFKYRNPSAVIDYSEKMIIHRGIQKGLSIIL